MLDTLTQHPFEKVQKKMRKTGLPLVLALAGKQQLTVHQFVPELSELL